MGIADSAAGWQRLFRPQLRLARCVSLSPRQAGLDSTPEFPLRTAGLRAQAGFIHKREAGLGARSGGPAFKSRLASPDLPGAPPWGSPHLGAGPAVLEKRGTAGWLFQEWAAPHLPKSAQPLWRIYCPPQQPQLPIYRGSTRGSGTEPRGHHFHLFSPARLPIHNVTANSRSVQHSLRTRSCVILQILHDSGTTIISILQMRRLRHRVSLLTALPQHTCSSPTSVVKMKTLGGDENDLHLPVAHPRAPETSQHIHSKWSLMNVSWDKRTKMGRGRGRTSSHNPTPA